MTGKGRGPGGYGSPLRLRWSRIARIEARHNKTAKKSEMEVKKLILPLVGAGKLVLRNRPQILLKLRL